MAYQSKQEKMKRIRSIIDRLNKSTDPAGCKEEIKALIAIEIDQEGSESDVGCCGIVSNLVPISLVNSVTLLEKAIATLEEGNIPETIELLEKYDG